MKDHASGFATFLKSLMVACILVLSALLAAAVFVRVGRQPVEQLSTTKVEASTLPQLPDYQGQIASLERQQAELHKQLADAEERIARLSRITWLMSLAHNENVNQIKLVWGDLPKGRELIVLDRNWKLSRMPTTMVVSNPEQRKSLQEDVAK